MGALDCDCIENLMGRFEEERKADRIQSCVDHINTAVDVDPWAKELVIEMGAEILKQLNNSNQEVKNANDCISKQGAIDICNIAIDLWQQCQPGEGALVAIKNAINNLPSVQPEIVPCGDCKHWICHDRRCGYWNHGVKPLEWCCHAERKENR